MTTPTPTPFSDIKWNEHGLIAAIAQDHITKDVLMLAWMNEKALRLTIAEQRGVYWSRSRSEIWRKGDTSGHVQHVKDIRLDCDKDAILLSVDQVGGKACHTGRPNCFFNQWQQDDWHINEAT
ncbi:MAG: phosphoribosyl-AMP cyclohydrolase [Pseudomonadota bacterium]